MTVVDQPFGRILLVDDDPDVRVLFRKSLENQRLSVVEASSIREMFEAIHREAFDLILLDLYLGEDVSTEAIPELVRETPRSQIVILTAYGSIEQAVKTMHHGASAFFLKSENPQQIAEKIRGMLGTARDNSPSLGSFGIIGNSQPMAKVLEKIQRIKDVASTVLIYGESGTGKELVAQALHKNSKRRDRRFIAINCGAIPEQLLESELFGHAKGAFTDAKAERKGVFEVCSDGTLLLDEIGEMPMNLQVKLLRVLQEREVRPVGSNRSVKIDTRVIAATNRNLRDEVRKGNFREDLFFRLNVVTIELPELRDRPGDIPLLVDHFVQLFSSRFDKTMAPPSREVLSRMMAYDWPGNVRELQNMVERGVVLSQDGHLHFEDMFSRHLHDGSVEKGEGFAAPCWEDEDGNTLPFGEAKKAFEQCYLQSLLRSSRGNVAEASRISGQYRANLYRMIQKYEIDCQQFR